MRVAMFHNRYARRGGEDEAFDREVDLLRKAGCEVFVFEVDSDEVRGPLGTARAARECLVCTVTRNVLPIWRALHLPADSRSRLSLVSMRRLPGAW